MIVIKGFARGVAGALLFSLPLLMTMELWRLAVSIDRWHLAVLITATVALTIGLTRTFGMVRGGVSWKDAIIDAGVAILAGTVAAAVILTALSIVHPLRSWDTTMSILIIEALPASVGAAYARAQLGQSHGKNNDPTYIHQMFLMAAGAVVFASNIAPTEEVVLLASLTSYGHTLTLILLSLTLMHAFVYTVGFAGQEQHDSQKVAFLTLTVPGYVIALGLSAFLLWSFGRYDDTSAYVALSEAVVLALPASVGAAAARLIL